MIAHSHRILSKSTLIVTALALSSTVIAGGPSRAQDKYPSRDVRAIVPFPPGGAMDAGVRIVQPTIAEHLGVAFVVETKTGAGGMIGTAAVASAPADGYTVAAGPSTTITLIGLTNKNVPYSPDDFIPLGNYAVDTGAIVVHADSPYKTIADLVADARKRPGKLSYASAGIGSVSSFVLAAIKIHYGLDMTEVPFRGSPPANTAVLGKQVDFGTVAFSNASPLIQSGKLRALAVSAEKRLPDYPNVPTLAEIGVPNASLGLTLGLYLRKDSPARAVEMLSDGLARAAMKPGTAENLRKIGLLVQYANPKGAREHLLAEYKSVRELGRKLKLIP